jgi:hypothetical protein
VKHTLLNHGILTEGMPLHAVSSLMAGFVCATFSAPFDNIKTRVMNQIGGNVEIHVSMAALILALLSSFPKKIMHLKFVVLKLLHCLIAMPHRNGVLYFQSRNYKISLDIISCLFHR